MASIVPTNGQAATGGPVPMMPGMGGASNGQMPAGAVPGTMPVASPTQVAQQNPMMPVGATPTVNGLPPGTQQTNGVNWADGSNTVTGDLKDTFGAGTGVGISNVLQNLGTSTDSAVQALISNTNLEADKQYANIRATQAASGITPDSSSAALAAGDFYSSVNSQLQSNVAGMELSQENTLLNTLLNTGQQHGPDVSTFEQIMGMLPSITSTVGSAAGAASAAGVGAGGGIGTLLGALAVL